MAADAEGLSWRFLVAVGPARLHSPFGVDARSDFMKTIVALILVFVASATQAGERSVTTTGTVQREIPADRAAMSLEVKATGKTIEESNAKLEHLMQELQAQIPALNYPTSALSLKFRMTQRGREWDDKDKKWVPVGYEASAVFSVFLVGLTNYGPFLTYVGTNDGHQIQWQSMASSAEGDARKGALAEALRAARSKAALLAQEGGTKLGKLLEVTEEEGEARELGGSTWGANARDPKEGTGVYPIGIFVRVRAKFELDEK